MLIQDGIINQTKNKKEGFTSHLIRTGHCSKCRDGSTCGSSQMHSKESRCCQGANKYCYDPLPVKKKDHNTTYHDTFDCPRGIAGYGNKCYCANGTWCGPAKHHDLAESLGQKGPPMNPKPMKDIPVIEHPFNTSLRLQTKKQVKSHNHSSDGKRRVKSNIPTPTPKTSETGDDWLQATATNYGDFLKVSADKISCSGCVGCDGDKYLGKTPCLTAKINCQYGSKCCSRGGLDERAGGGCYQVKCVGGVPGSDIVCRTQKPIVLKVIDNCQPSKSGHFVKSTGRPHMFDMNDQAMSQIATGLGAIKVDYKQVPCSQLPKNGVSHCFPNIEETDNKQVIVSHPV